MRSEDKIRVVIADDHPIFRSGLRQIIEEDKGIEIVGEADNGATALDLIHELNPDVAVLDIDMPSKTGLEVLKELTGKKPAVIFLTVYADEDIYDEAMELGISGYVLKDSAVSDIVESIYKVHEGKYFISTSVSNFLLSRRDRLKKFESKEPTIEMLTKSERIILKLISEGKTSREISAILDSSFKTIENHRTNISNKLNLKGANSLVKFAIENRSNL